MSTEPPTISDPPPLPPRVTTVQRIAALEEQIAAHEDTINQLLTRHNLFVNTITDELGL